MLRGGGIVIAGVALSRRFRLSPKKRAVIKTMDVKISKFLRMARRRGYRESERFYDDRNEILGSLEILYLIDAFTQREYKEIIRRVNGD